MSKKNKFETNAIHIGNEPDSSTGSISPPIHLTSTYVQEGIGKNKGFDYSRGKNPTRQRLEKNIASLEGGYDAIAFSSGMAATTALFQELNQGDRIKILKTKHQNKVYQVELLDGYEKNRKYFVIKDDLFSFFELMENNE